MNFTTLEQSHRSKRAKEQEKWKKKYSIANYSQDIL